MNKFKSIISASIIMMALSACGTNTSSVTSSVSSSSSSSSSTSTSSSSSTISFYTIYFDLNGGTSPSYVPSKTIETLNADTLFYDVTKTGYNFRGWEVNGVLIYDEHKQVVNDITLVDGLTFKARFAQTAKLTIVSNMPEAGTYGGGKECEYYSYCDVFAHPYQGYNFVGWYQIDNSTLQYDVLIATEQEYKFLMWTEDVTIQAKFEIASFNLHIYSNNNDLGKVFDTASQTKQALDEYNISHKYLSTVTISAITSTDTYRFLGWYDENNKLVSPNAVYTFDMVNYDYTLEAKWNRFTITYNLDGGVNNPLNPSTYSIEDTKQLYTPTKTYYDFIGWEYDGNIISEIKGSIAKHIELTAKWKATQYSISYILNGGVNNPLNPSGYNYESDDTVLSNPSRTGYSFTGWYENNVKITSIPKNSSGNKTIEAKWTPITYNISYVLNGGSQNPSNPTTYTIEDSKSLYDPTKTGYSFNGWYNGDTKVTSIPKGTYGDLTLTAHWSINSYNVTVTSSDTNKGTVTGSGTYEYNSNVTVIATPIGDCVFKGWFSDSELTQKVSKDSSYSFVIPANDVTLYAKFWTKAEEEEEWNIAHGVIPTVSQDGKYITYGMYPQTNVNDSSLISTLNTLTSPNEYGYYFYNNEYYYKYTATPYTSGYTFDSGTIIVNGTTYWFKVEPIKWRILDNEDGTYFITTESLLVNHMYNSYYSGTQSKTDYQGNTATVYANNYKYSDIRSWLNTDFYNQAFFLDNDNIKVSTVDNSVASTLYSSNSYVCENTNDKLFLLSAKELTTSKYGFAISTSTYDTARQCKTTDYARAHGVCMDTSSSYLNNGWYYTRSPDFDHSRYARGVYFVGHVDLNYNVDGSDHGVRLALRLSLDE